MSITLEPPQLHMADKSVDSIPTRQSLLERLKDWGDQSSWQDFFDTYWQLIYNVAIKAGLTDAEAQEVVQETVIAVSKNISEFKTDPAHGSFSAWLMQLTRWRIADQFRKGGKLGATSCQSPAGQMPVAYPDDTGSTDSIERIPDPAALALDTVWQEEWQQHLMTTALEHVKRQVSPRQ